MIFHRIDGSTLLGCDADHRFYRVCINQRFGGVKGGSEQVIGHFKLPRIRCLRVQSDNRRV